MITQEPKIRITGVSKRFGRKSALEDINMSVATGRKTVLVGPAASGKTVLMKCISGIHVPTSGTIEIDEVRVSKAGGRDHTKLMQSVGVLFQQGGLFDGLTVWRNVAFKLTQTHGIPDAEAREAAIDHLAAVNLPPETADLFPGELSGGMQKRVGIARAMAGNPSLLLLDEPTAGLDPITTRAINRLIDQSIKGTGTTVLSITSDMEAARHDYDDLYMLNQGRVVWHGETAAIDESDNPYIRQMIDGKAKGPIEVLV